MKTIIELEKEYKQAIIDQMRSKQKLNEATYDFIKATHKRSELEIAYKIVKKSYGGFNDKIN